ncbi:unnamed protein product [Adineta ricciae]|uniref:Uncharacterized protein n=2 Tax=Adineta ricciae TaxID=249248 RepID=A0A813TCU1_ADIRI|nr:unnamed protein product [Adineta ricciae]
MLAVFMAFTPRDHPYYTNHDSRMETRSNPLSPGLGFRPQPDVDRNIIEAEKNKVTNTTRRYTTSLDQYLRVYYWTPQVKQGSSRNVNNEENVRTFRINNPGECTVNRNFGYTTGQPCVLIKMNKIVEFVPEPLDAKADKSELPDRCQQRNDAVAIACQGEYPADIDNIGQIRYYSEDNVLDTCGSLKKSWFPYNGKQNRKDIYQAPYVWAQFLNPKPNILINVICRVYAENIDFDKKTNRGLTRFQIYVNDEKRRSSQNAGEI